MTLLWQETYYIPVLDWVASDTWPLVAEILFSARTQRSLAKGPGKLQAPSLLLGVGGTVSPQGIWPARMATFPPQDNLSQLEILTMTLSTRKVMREDGTSVCKSGSHVCFGTCRDQRAGGVIGR